MSLRPTDDPAASPPAPASRLRAWLRQHLSPRLWLSHALALLGALVCVGIGTPLPWLIGPLLVTAGLSMSGRHMPSTPSLRNAGQWAIGTALGLYFTPQVMGVVFANGWAIVAGIVWAGVIGIAFSAFLARHHPGGDDARPTAFFAGAIGGASEMSLLAERHHGRVDLVAAAHSVRILLVVMIMPFAFQWAGVTGLDASSPGPTRVDAAGLLMLVVLTSAAGVVMTRLRTPNPVILGALAVAMALSVSGIELSALPTWMINLGQLFIGVSLGTRFSREFLHSAPRWLLASAAGTLGVMAASALFAWGLATLAGLHPAVLMLGTSPGGIAEMCITAKVLQLGVPIVTAFHVTRMVAVVVCAQGVYRWVGRSRILTR